jgi:hypothetical protein
MRLRMMRLALIATIALAFSLDASASEPKVNLNKDEKKVIDHLVKHWGEDYDVTSVDVAMESLKMKPSDSARLRIGTYIKQNPGLHEAIRQWGWVTIVLNADEKLIARMLINAQRDDKPTPSVSNIARAVLITEDQVKRGLAVLERYEILQRDKSAAGPGYRVAQRYVKWEPRLDFIFHTVTLDDGRKFSVN